MSLTIAVGATAVLALLLGLIILPLNRTTLVAVSVVLITLSSTYLDRDGGGNIIVSAGVRIAALVVLFRLRWPVRGESPLNAVRLDGRYVYWFAPWLLLGMTLYLIAATLPHGEGGTFLMYGQGALLGLAYALVIFRYVTGPQILHGVLLGLLAVVSCSLLMLLASPGLAMLGGRFRGVTSNPNTLGFYCAIAVALLLFNKRRVFVLACGGAACVGALALTASRASLVVIAITIIGWLALRESAASRLMAMVGAAAGATVLVQYPGLLTGGEVAIFRTDNSREISLDYTRGVLDSHGDLGIGLGNEIVQVASTPLRALVHGGYVGGGAVLLMYLTILFFSWRSGRQTLLFGIAMIVHSFFEGWLLSPVAPMFLLFLAAWYGCAGNDLLESDSRVDSVPVPPPDRKGGIVVTSK